MSLRTRRARLGSLLAVALGALALLALPALAGAKDGSGSHSNGRENAGTVASYDSESGELTIDLKAGGTATALVNEDTRIRCVGVKRGGHRHHQHRGRGRGHQGEESTTSARRNGKKARRGQHRRRGHACTTEALTEGATIRKARIDSEEDGDVFTKILVEKSKAKGDCDDKPGDDDAAEEGGEGAGEDDDGTPDQGPGDV